MHAMQGIPVYDADKNEVGISRKAATQAVVQTAISRVGESSLFPSSLHIRCCCAREDVSFLFRGCEEEGEALYQGAGRRAAVTALRSARGRHLFPFSRKAGHSYEEKATERRFRLPCGCPFSSVLPLPVLLLPYPIMSAFNALLPLTRTNAFIKVRLFCQISSLPFFALSLSMVLLEGRPAAVSSRHSGSCSCGLVRTLPVKDEERRGSGGGGIQTMETSTSDASPNQLRISGPRDHAGEAA